MNLWISKPGSDKPSATLTFSVYALIICLGKFMLNGVEVDIMGKVFKFGMIDSGLIAAVLTPTLGAYTLKKFAGGSSTPVITDTKETSE